MRVLLIEDDADLAEVVLIGLRQEHLAVDHAADISAATAHLLTTKYDIVCLDLGLPDGDGLDLCRQLHAAEGELALVRPHRLIILTARDAVAARVAGLDAGADDYLVKPFKVAELAARLRALSRRSDHPPQTLTVGDVRIDLVTHRATRGDRDLALTSKEFAVLHHFCAHADEIVSSEDLLEHCWDAHADVFTSSVRVILSRLRHKLGDPAIINTIKGAGYRMGSSS